MGIWVGINILENCFTVYYTIEYKYSLSPSNTPGYVPNRNSYVCSPKDMYKIAHSSTVHYSYKLATIVEWINDPNSTISSGMGIYYGIFAQIRWIKCDCTQKCWRISQT